MQLILNKDVEHLGIAGRILHAQLLNQNPVNVSDLCCFAILHFSSDAKILRIMFFLHPENMPIY